MNSPAPGGRKERILGRARAVATSAGGLSSVAGGRPAVLARSVIGGEFALRGRSTAGGGSARGSATVWTLALACLLIVAGHTTAALAAVVSVSHRADTAADLAALSALGGGCSRAREVAAANGARLVGCRFHGTPPVAGVVPPPAVTPGRTQRTTPGTAARSSAGAPGPASPGTAQDSYAGSNTGLIVDIKVEVRTGPIFGQTLVMRSRARAGYSAPDVPPRGPAAGLDRPR